MLRSSVAPTIAYLLLSAIIGLLLGPAILGQERLAFRDTGHFYTPLYEYVAARQRETWIPLWNPLDLTGLPLVGETTTAVFYPPRIIVYALISRPESAIACYVALHLMWAAVTVHIAARVAGADSLGCAIAILCYPLAGPIFFNIHNVPFLVGASWLPLALAGTLRLIQQPDARWIAVTAMGLALPTLGGDPQTTVHALMIMIPLIAWRTVLGYHQRRALKHTVCGLLAAILLSAIVAAPQLAASIAWARHTQRLTSTAASQQYDFSVAPWHWAELWIPEAAGRLFPTYTRISHAIPTDGRTWVTTLYVGLVPLLFAIHRYTRWNRRNIDFWDALLPLGLLFAMAGPYWLLVTCVPGYSAFRYPAKWLTFAALGLAIVAARETRQIVPGNLRSIRSICCWSAIGSALTAGIVVLVGSSDRAMEVIGAQSLKDIYWGPFTASLAVYEIATSALGVTAIACAVWFSVGKARLVGPLLLCLMAIDLYVVARPQVATINLSAEAGLIGSRVSSFQGRAMRISIGNPWPASWSTTIDPLGRLLAVATSERATGFGRWHLSSSEAVFNTSPTLRPQRIEAFWSAIDSQNLRVSRPEVLQNWQRIEAWLGISRQLIVTSHEPEPNRPAIATARAHLHPDAAPFCCWDNVWKTISPQQIVTANDFATRLSEIISRSSTRVPVIEANDVDSPSELSENTASAQIELLLMAPEKIQIRISATNAGLLTVKSFQDGNWKAMYESTGTANKHSHSLHAFPVDYLFMGTIVPAGDAIVTFAYDPWWLNATVATSLVGYLLLLSLLVFTRWTAAAKYTLDGSGAAAKLKP